MKKLSILLALAGLAVSVLLVAWTGAEEVFSATISIGLRGFALLACVQMALFALLGLAWTAILPGARPGVMIWGRMVRDSATNCLPFSPIGGFVVGARAATLHGVPWPSSVASTVVDATAEVLAQFGFALLGLLLLLAYRPGTAIAGPVATALALVALFAAIALLLRRRIGRMFGALGRRIAGGWFPDAQARLDRLQDEFARLYGRPGKLLLGTGLHLAGWVGTGVITWLTYRLLGAELELQAAIAIEALLDALVAAAFVVPASAGVLELGFAGLGAVFGLPPGISLSVSLLRRAKDLALGVPILLVWQFVELRRLRTAPPG